jgi:hypothetical protein
MLTVVETPLFQKQWPLYWSEDELGEFAAYIAEHPDAGAVVPESGGIRKVRWGTNNLTAAKLKEIRRALES